MVILQKYIEFIYISSIAIKTLQITLFKGRRCKMHKVIITSLHTNCNEPEIKEQNCWEYQELSYFGAIVN